jgi:hypothetical protein
MIKRQLNIALSLLLVLVVMAGSGGISLYKMSCYTSGNVAFSLEKDFCCAPEKSASEQSRLEPVCCNFDQLDFKVSAYDYQLKQDQPVPFQAALVFLVIRFFQPQPLVPVFEADIPPLTATGRLAMLCVFRI